jgi:hypothetical protein
MTFSPSGYSHMPIVKISLKSIRDISSMRIMESMVLDCLGMMTMARCLPGLFGRPLDSIHYHQLPIIS